MTKPRTILDVARERKQARSVVAHTDRALAPEEMAAELKRVSKPAPPSVPLNYAIDAAPQSDPNDAQRLPDGSKFDVLYDAVMVDWCGTLTVPAFTGGVPLIFAASAPSVFGLLKRLDAKYRASLRAEE